MVNDAPASVKEFNTTDREESPDERPFPLNRSSNPEEKCISAPLINVSRTDRLPSVRRPHKDTPLAEILSIFDSRTG